MSTAKATVRRKALALLTPADRRRALLAMGTSLLSAAMSGLMIWSLVPFAELRFDPTAVERGGMLTTAYRLLGAPAPYDMLRILGAVSALLALAMFLVQMLQTVSVARFAAGLTHHLSRRLLTAYLHQPYEFFLDRHSSGLSANILSEAEAAVSQFYRPLIQLGAGLVTTATVIAVLALMNAGIVLMLACAGAAAYGVSYLAVRGRVRRLGARRSEANLDRFRHAGEGLQSIKDVKLLGREEAYLARFDTPSQAVMQTTVAAQFLGSLPAFALRAAALVGGILFCLLYVGEADFLDGRALGDIAPELGVLAVAAQRLLPEIQRIINSMLRLQFGVAPVERLHDDLARRAATPEPPPTHRLRLHRTLRFEDVSYRYPGADGHGLTSVTLDIEAGHKIGIVGRSGAGKTTLGDLALGLLPPTAGRLLVDEVEIDDEARGPWRQSVGFVPQDIFLADASVAENIALGLSTDEIDMDRVRGCGRLARIDAFVTGTLAEGYATPVGERGVRLSGGQRQRLAIARALYRDADLIVFDEATSALDNRTEAEVMEALRGLPGEKTILIIAHRLSTLEVCDEIIVLEDGRVAGRGTYRELQAECAAFQRLASQTAA